MAQYLAMQLRRYIWISWVGEWMKRMSNLTDKFEAGITLFTQMIVSFLVEVRSTNTLAWLAVSSRRQEGLKLWRILSVVN